MLHLIKKNASSVLDFDQKAELEGAVSSSSASQQRVKSTPNF